MMVGARFIALVSFNSVGFNQETPWPLTDGTRRKPSSLEGVQIGGFLAGFSHSP
jgi:hypothetical protein